MTPKGLSDLIGISPQEIRKFARSKFNKPEGNWDFTEEQVEIIKNHFIRKDGSQLGSQNTKDDTIQWLTEEAQKFLKENYKLELKIPIRVNNRLSRALGRFTIKQLSPFSSHPRAIEIGARTIKYYGKEVTLDVLKHELVHYACFTLGKPFRDGDRYFENELKRLGITRTETYQLKGPAYQYSCSNCGSKIYSHRKLKNPAYYYSSKCCGASLVFEGKTVLS